MLPVWSGLQHPMLASGSLDGSLKLWEHGACATTLRGDGGPGGPATDTAERAFTAPMGIPNCLVVVPPGVLATGHDGANGRPGGLVHFWF